MANHRHWIAYDWFKLIVALIVLIVLIILMLRPSQSAPAVSSGLPAYPTAGFTWKYDTASGALMDPQGARIYQLSTDGKAWQPVIPADIQAELPPGYQLSQGPAGAWAIRDAQGNLLRTWDAQSFQWSAGISTQITAGQPTPTSTLIPNHTSTVAASATINQSAAVIPTRTTVPTTVPTPEATATPTATRTPVATVAPTAAPPTATLSTGAQPATAVTATETANPTGAPSGAPSGTPTATVAATPVVGTAPTSAGNCQTSTPSRLVAGKTAKVLSNLNMRSEPKIANNIITTNPTGAVLKVLQGPVCVPYQNSAYLWWQVENQAGKVGWSAENFLNGVGYFLLPIP